MQSPTLLFIYRAAQTEAVCIAKCVSCSTDDTLSWDPDASWRGFVLPDGPFVQVRLDVSDEVSSVDEPGTEAVYDSERVIRNADPGKVQRLLALQNCTFIKLPADIVLPKLPFFMSFNELTVPAYTVALAELLVTTIEEIPDVRRYVRRREQRAMDKWDRLAIQQDNALPPAPLPEQCFLPANLVFDGRSTGCVYRIRRFRTPSLAEVDMFVSDRAVTVKRSAVLERTAQSSDGHTETREVGRLVEILSYSDTLPELSEE